MNSPKKMVIFSNWKIYMKSRNEVESYAKIIEKNLKVISSKFIQIYIIADFLSFEYLKKRLQHLNIGIGVQDLFWEDYGPYAGEVSPSMLKDLGCDCAYFGHSERRSMFGETDKNINKKIKAALRNDITPILFVGETIEELQKGQTDDVLRAQLQKCLEGISIEIFKKVIVVYEPRWAIGQKDAASAQTIKPSHLMVRKLIA